MFNATGKVFIYGSVICLDGTKLPIHYVHVDDTDGSVMVTSDDKILPVVERHVYVHNWRKRTDLILHEAK